MSPVPEKASPPAPEGRILRAHKLESLSTVAMGIAHDFNNFLAAIAGNLNIVIKNLPDSAASAREHAHHAELITAKAVDLANQLLLYAGKGRFSPQRVNVAGLAAEVAESLRPSLPKNITLELNLPQDLPPITLDVSQIRLLVTHLVNNAAEAYLGEPGRITVSAGSMYCDRQYLSQTVVETDMPEDQYTFLEMADEGPGIPPDILPRVFDPFFSTRIRGHGMGLSIVFGVARAHAAAIVMRTAPGKGTTVRVLFQTRREVVDAL